MIVTFKDTGIFDRVNEDIKTSSQSHLDCTCLRTIPADRSTVVVDKRSEWSSYIHRDYRSQSPLHTRLFTV